MLLLFDSRVTIYPYFLMLFDAVSVLIINSHYQRQYIFNVYH